MLDTITISPQHAARVARLRSRLLPLATVLEGVAKAASTARPYQGVEPFHDAWCANAAAPFQVRLAHAQAAWRGAVRPVVIPDQLIVGTPPPRVIIAYYTGVFCWDFILDITLAGAHPHGREIVAYWQRWLRERPQPALPAGSTRPSLTDCLWISGICCHSTQDYQLLLSGGLAGLRERLEQANVVHPEAQLWYRAAAIALDGVSAYLGAHADALMATAESAAGVQAAEWRVMAANCRYLADGHAPETFHQAVQLFYAVFQLNGHDSPGRMDQYLWPALQRDLDRGMLSLADAQQIVDCLYLQLAEYICYGATLGGQLPAGGDATNTLTWLSLNSIRRLRLLSPRTALRWHRDTPEELYRAAIRTIATGTTFPTLVNDEAMIPSLLRRGVAPEHVRDYTFCGCGQVIPSGRAYGSYEDLILNAAKPLTYALHDGRDERSGAQIGPNTGAAETLDSFAALEEAVWTQMIALLSHGIETTAAWRRWGAEQVPDFLRSLLTHSCLERGLDWRAGGADYHEGMVDIVGFTTLTDALLAIKCLVYDEQRMTLPALIAILDRDWAAEDALRAACLRDLPKFGNEHPEADHLLQRWITRVNDWLLTQRTAFGGPWGMDIIGWSGAVALGAVTGATADGRHASEPLADCAGPAQGRDRSGITAVLNSMLALPMREVHGPLALNLRIPETIIQSPEEQMKLAALLQSYLQRDGQQVQITVAGAETLRAAQRDPAAHRDLIVRVGGFSAYFVTLEQQYQDDMISRTEHSISGD